MSPREPRFGTLLVANRGEIALRVIRGAQAEGLRTVAVYSDADVRAPHVSAADIAIPIGPATASESYLSIPTLIAAARRAGADAVHPGYGFLSERAEFARACAEAGLTFVGPPADVIELMGRKDSARAVAVAAGVPVVPAVVGDDVDDLMARAGDEVGYPLLVKAAAGGGGKGMRVVRGPADLAGAVAAARREAAAAFGDDTVLIERYVERGRHVEVQVLADEHGSVIHLFERDCSTQRRYQKVVEEAPAPTISDGVRSLVTESAVNLARRAGYVNAGTVEFLVDGEEVYLLEMNTRLQVEHPVTELVTGRDLVRLQLLVAQGEPLPLTQADVTVRGHAIEARVYAEDPKSGFLPQGGVASGVRWPHAARVDEALRAGQTVSLHYDPMLAKIIVHGATRELARQALVGALDETAVHGLPTNLGFLRRLVDSPEFAQCEIDTAWLDGHPGRWVEPVDDDDVWVAAAWLTATSAAAAGDSPGGGKDGWRSGGAPVDIRVDLRQDGHTRHFGVAPSAGAVREQASSWQVRVVGGEAADIGGVRETYLEIEGTRTTVLWSATPSGVRLSLRGWTYDFDSGDLRRAGPQESAGGQLVAPMPGQVTALHVTVGQEVEAGQLLGVIEAMKMEHTLTAPVSGVVHLVSPAVGDQVSRGKVLFEIEPAAD